MGAWDWFMTNVVGFVIFLGPKAVLLAVGSGVFEPSHKWGREMDIRVAEVRRWREEQAAGQCDR